MSYKLHLTHRGKQIGESIDLFDECHFGADKLFLRGNFGNLQDVYNQVKISLGDIDSIDVSTLQKMYENETIDDKFYKEKLGIGNPLTLEDAEIVPKIALNRYHIPNKKFWNNVIPSDVENPHKASAVVKFSLRLHFRDDFAYIDFGCPWEFTKEYGISDVNLDEESTFEDFMNNFVLLECHFISKEDALIVLDEMFGNVSKNMDVLKKLKTEPQIEVETTELIDEDGSIIAL